MTERHDGGHTQHSALSTQHSKKHSALRLMVVAGEASGDRHAARLVDAIRELEPSVEVFGSGGEELRSRGVELLVDVRDVNIIGVPEVIRGIRRLYGAYRRL